MANASINLYNEALLQDYIPPVDDPRRAPGELWVNSETLQLYVFNDDLANDGSMVPGWVGVTTAQNQGSIVYSGEEPPMLDDVYENLNVGAVALDPLPGTLWFDTKINHLKIWYVVATGDDADPYRGSWVSVTVAHYLTEAMQGEVNELQAKVTELENQVDELQAIIDALP